MRGLHIGGYWGSVRRSRATGSRLVKTLSLKVTRPGGHDFHTFNLNERLILNLPWIVLFQ